MKKYLYLLLPALLLTGCGVAPVTAVIDGSDTLRGSAYAKFGPVSFSAENLDGLNCEGKTKVAVSGTGTLTCNDGRTGNFIINYANGYWIGDGKLDDGKKFKLYINKAPEELKS